MSTSLTKVEKAKKKAFENRRQSSIALVHRAMHLRKVVELTDDFCEEHVPGELLELLDSAEKELLFAAIDLVEADKVVDTFLTPDTVAA
jgi:hypothetical protein